MRSDVRAALREILQRRWPLVAVVILVFFTQLGSYGLLEPDEGRYAESGREMAEPGSSWLIPTVDGIPHFQKPPMIYWMTAISMKLFGASEISARVPSALSAVATLLLAMGISSRLFRNERAIRNALVILASSPLFLFLGRTLTPDMHMTFWITAAIFCLVYSRQDGEQTGRPALWGWLFFVCAGLGFLTKGPVAFLVPFSAAIGYSVSLKRQKENSGRLCLPWIFGIPLALLIGLSWFLVVSFREPGLAEYFLQKELLDRFGSTSHGRSKPFWFFIPVFIGGFLPWTIIGAPFLRSIFRNRSPLLGLFFGWLLVPLVVLSFSGSKLPTYVLPLFPALAIALGAGLGARPTIRPPLKLGAVIILMAIAFTPLIVSGFVIDPSPGISPASWLSAVVLCVGIALWGLRWSKSERWSTVSLGLVALAGWMALPSHVTGWNNLFAQQASIKPLAERILKESEGNADASRIIACEIRAHGLAFYLRRTVEITRREADIILPSATRFLKMPTIHEKPGDVARLRQNGDQPIFVVTRSWRSERDFLPKGWTQVQTSGDFVLLTRR